MDLCWQIVYDNDDAYSGNDVNTNNNNNTGDCDDVF